MAVGLTRRAALEIRSELMVCARSCNGCDVVQELNPSSPASQEQTKGAVTLLVSVNFQRQKLEASLAAKGL